MRNSLATLAASFAALLVTTGASSQETDARPNAEFHWLAFPDSAKFKLLGLYWFDESNPKLWRMPASAMNSLPKGVQGRSRCPSGGRIVMTCATTRLALKVTAPGGGTLQRFNVSIDGQPCKPPVADKAGAENELILFRDWDHREKRIVIDLPHLQEVVVHAIGVDEQSHFSKPDPSFARPLPVVFYGSSVCQGSGALNPGQTYASILCRALNLDFINLGFGGAGKAETNVVDLVNAIPACCYVFDLGKSYGMQDASAFKAMLQTVRRSHPEIPIIVITPITSARETTDPAYSTTSVHCRTVMRNPVNELIKAGEKQLFLVEGEDLIGFKEHAVLSGDGVHPSDQGYDIIARKLTPLMMKVLGL